MNRREYEQLFQRFSGLRIGVIGDMALDGYWNLAPAASLPSVETGKPTQSVARHTYAAGAAGNVASNLLALGCRHVHVFGVLGHDPWGNELARVLDRQGAAIKGLLRQEKDWSTVAYMKPHIDGEEQSRLDFGDFNLLHERTADRLLRQLDNSMPELDAVVINAQARSSIHNRYLASRLAALIRRWRGSLFVVDSRYPENLYQGCVVKINASEAVRYRGKSPCAAEAEPRPVLHKVAARMFAERGKTVFVTRGEEGILVSDTGGLTEVPALPAGGTVETTGAGDAALAGITAALAAGASPVQAAFTGNLAAAVSVRKTQETGTAAPDEMLALHDLSP